MGFLDDEQIAALAEMETVYSAKLIELEFKDQTVRVWDGAALLKTGDGLAWSGLGEFLSITGLEQPIGATAQQARFILSGVDPTLLAVAKNSADQAKGRAIMVYGQFFDDGPKPFGPRFPIWSGIMETLEYRMEGDSKRVIELSAENLFSRRRRPAYGLNTDRDQQNRFPGDLGMSFTGAVTNKTVTWPDN